MSTIDIIRWVLITVGFVVLLYALVTMYRTEKLIAQINRRLRDTTHGPS